jgi:hypothetical protein
VTYTATKQFVTDWDRELFTGTTKFIFKKCKRDPFRFEDITGAFVQQTQTRYKEHCEKQEAMLKASSARLVTPPPWPYKLAHGGCAMGEVQQHQQVLAEATLLFTFHTTNFAQKSTCPTILLFIKQLRSVNATIPLLLLF